jgi:hypothetical protein
MLSTAEKALVASSVVLVFFLMYSFVEGLRVTYHHIFLVNESDLPLGKLPGYIFLSLFETLTACLMYHYVTEFGEKNRFLRLKIALYKLLRAGTPAPSSEED